MIRIGIDCRLAGSAHAGIGRYVANLVTELTALNTDWTWVLFFADATQVKELWPTSLPSNVEVVWAPIQHYSLAEQWRWPQIVSQAQLQLLHVPHFNIPLLYSGKMVVTIHDLLWHEYRGAHVTTLSPVLYWLKYWAYRFVVGQAVARAAHIIVPAETIKKTVTRYYKSAKAKVVVTAEGIAPAFAAEALQPASSHQPKTELVYVGSLYPHKNVKRAIEALRYLPSYALNIVGVRTVFQQPLRRYAEELGVSEQVRWLGYVADQDLIALLKKSWALLQPSLSEGFGLTGIEAMAAGVPVIASKIPIFEEVYQDAALLFDPTSTDALVEKIQSLTPSTRAALIRRGKKVATTYQWSKMAVQTEAVYREVLKSTKQ